MKNIFYFILFLSFNAQIFQECFEIFEDAISITEDMEDEESENKYNLEDYFYQEIKNSKLGTSIHYFQSSFFSFISSATKSPYFSISIPPPDSRLA